MRRVVISTVGTSLLTNQINRANSDENPWYNRLRDTANLSKKEIEEKHPGVDDIIKALQERAIAKLKKGDVASIRRASAELNGIYGLYENQLSQAKQDVHWLIPTDTAQGKTTAEIVQSFLQDSERGLNVSIYDESPGISTASTSIFSDGMDTLIAWLRETLPSWKDSGYKVCFNLVGSFKSLQGYLNTIGMFYADEIIGSPDFVVENRAFPGLWLMAHGMENAFPARLSPKILVFLITKESGEPNNLYF